MSGRKTCCRKQKPKEKTKAQTHVLMTRAFRFILHHLDAAIHVKVSSVILISKVGFL